MRNSELSNAPFGVGRLSANHDGINDDAERQDRIIREQLIKEGEPMFITNIFVEKPCTVLISGFTVLMIITIISFFLGYFKLNPQHDREYLVWDHNATFAWDKLEAGK